MSVQPLTNRQVVAVSRPGLSTAGKTTVAFLVLLGIGALAGGIALVARPDGSVMHFDTALLSGSPFADYLVPGLILGGFFGLGSLAVATLGLRGWKFSPAVAFVIGCGQMTWIVIELLIIKELSFLQPSMFGVGLVIAGAAIPWGRPTYLQWLGRQ